MVKTWNFNWKKTELVIFVFSGSVFQMSFNTRKDYLNQWLIYIIITNTVYQSQIDLGFHWFYWEITWKIHGNFVSREKWKPCIYTAHLIDCQQRHGDK